MPAGGTLEVRGTPAAARGARSVRLEIIDTGEGMDSLVLQKARDPFFTTRAAGTGLGLAIAVRVVKNHGGTLEIESEAGAGTTVHILLPVDRPSSVPPPPEDP
jgi:signal transduction histidine kinase